MSYDDLIKFRSSSELVRRLERIAKANRRDLPDLLRIVLEDYAKEEEQKLHFSENPAPYKTAAPGISSDRKAELDAKVEEFVKGTIQNVRKTRGKKKTLPAKD